MKRLNYTTKTVFTIIFMINIDHKKDNTKNEKKQNKTLFDV